MIRQLIAHRPIGYSTFFKLIRFYYASSSFPVFSYDKNILCLPGIQSVDTIFRDCALIESEPESRFARWPHDAIDHLYRLDKKLLSQGILGDIHLHHALLGSRYEKL